MSPHLQKRLFDAFPKIFADRLKPMTHTAMCWGIECRDGWYELLYDLCLVIQDHIDSPLLTSREQVTVPQVVATQVKEQFGTLRFYYRGGDEYIFHIVRAFELLSGVHCEVCGARGQRYGRSWLQTLCREHAVKAGLCDAP
jgi:hypothetical protein